MFCAALQPRKEPTCMFVTSEAIPVCMCLNLFVRFRIPDVCNIYLPKRGAAACGGTHVCVFSEPFILLLPLYRVLFVWEILAYSTRSRIIHPTRFPHVINLLFSVRFTQHFFSPRYLSSLVPVLVVWRACACACVCVVLCCVWICTWLVLCVDLYLVWSSGVCAAWFVGSYCEPCHSLCVSRVQGLFVFASFWCIHRVLLYGRLFHTFNSRSAVRSFWFHWPRYNPIPRSATKRFFEAFHPVSNYCP